MIKLAGNAAEDRGVANIREAEAAARQSAEVAVLGNEDHGFAHPRRLDRSGDTARGVTINHNIRFMGFLRRDQGA